MKKTIAFGFLFLGLLFVTTICLGQSYTITDLGTLPGSSSSFGQGINTSGQVTGGGGKPPSNAFLYSAGTGMVDLGTLPGASFSAGQGINASGQVAGLSDPISGTYHAFLYRAGTGMVDLGTLPGGNFSVGLGINDSGQVTGWSNPSAGTAHAFLYSAGTGMVDLGTLPGGNSSVGQGINASGQVTGGSDASGNLNTYHAFLYSAGTGMVDLGTLPGGTSSFGQAINVSGQVAGYAVTTSGTYHAFLYSTGTGMVDLGTLPGSSSSFGQGINTSGQVTGYVVMTSGTVHAFLYSAATGMIDLNTMLPSGSGWTLDAATGINDAGQITGYGTSPNGATHAFLLSPQATCVPVRPVAKDIIQNYGNIPSWSKGLPHNGIDYRSPLGNTIPSVGPNGVIHQFTKPDARQFGSINPNGDGPAIWVKHTLRDGTPIFVLYGHTATTWVDKSTGSGKTFNFDATYTLQWRRGNVVGANTMMGKTAPFYNGGILQPHLHISVFRPTMACKNNTVFCDPPTSGWGYSSLSLSTGDYINPEDFFTNPQFCLAN